jgi:hypothetical protein
VRAVARGSNPATKAAAEATAVQSLRPPGDNERKQKRRRFRRRFKLWT